MPAADAPAFPPVVLTFAACLPKVRDSDRAAWRNVPVIELERHPLFSTMPREVRPLSDLDAILAETKDSKTLIGLYRLKDRLGAR